MTTHRDNYAALTALFTTPGESRPPSISRPTVLDERPLLPEPRVECIIPGHLPVRAAVWFLPCARMLVGEDNDGAIIRLEDDTAGLSMFSSRRTADHVAWRDLPSALEMLSHRVKRWCIVPRVDFDPQHLQQAGMDRITILTGTDQAAIVAAYQLIKSIAAGPDCPNQLGVFCAGSAPDVAQETAGRLRETVHRQLDIDLVIRGSLHRIEGDMALLRTGRFPGAVAGMPDLVADLRRSLAAAENEAAGSLEEPMPVMEPSSIPMVDRILRPPVEHPGAPSPLAIDPVVPSTEPRSDPARGSLASHVEGLQSLPVNCPSSRDVELAVDDAGCVHCLADVEHLRQVHAAATWVRSHGSILSMACPDAQLREAAEPTCHLFTEHPLEVNDLQGTGFRLHLLTRVEAGSESTWFACPLA